jgi:hypothetical protein
MEYIIFTVLISIGIISRATGALPSIESTMSTSQLSLVPSEKELESKADSPLSPDVEALRKESLFRPSPDESQPNDLKNGLDEIYGDLQRNPTTTSMAISFSLPHEIAFISIICSAQITTRKSIMTLIAARSLILIATQRHVCRKQLLSSIFSQTISTLRLLELQHGSWQAIA